MFKFIALAALVALTAGQNYRGDPKTAAIISEQRYQSGNGQFGAAYTQEDGTDFKEETDEQGNRRGSYSYVDPDGQKRTISYTAGKNGFVASGDHLPVAPPAPPQPIPQNQYQRSQYQESEGGHSQQFQAGEKGNDGDDGSYDERWNDPSFSGNGGGRAISAPRAAQAPQQQYNNYNSNYNYQPQAAPIPAGPPAPIPQYNNRQYSEPQYTTQNPHRFQPPGKLSLNRTPDGYSYSFNKV